MADGGEIARLIGTDVRDLMVAAIEHRFGMVFVRSKMPWVSISGDTTKREEMG